MKSIENLYNEIIQNPQKWVYWNYNEDISKKVNEILPNFSSLFVQNSGEKLIKLLLHIGEKNNGVLVSNIEKLSPERKRHIVSLFFIGHILYEHIDIIKEKINLQLENLIFPKQEEKVDTQKLFSFFWLLLCLFHDLGYGYEDGIVVVESDLSIEEIYKKLKKEFYPNIYNVENLNRHNNYRLCKWGVKDHGIWGGKVFFNDMLQIKDYLQQKYITDKTCVFCIGDVDYIYAYAAWIIMCHNLRYDDGRSDYTSCFKCQHLDDFIKPKARCISLKSNPLLFLFCLADTIEPTKALYSLKKGVDNDRNICKLLELKFEGNTMSFNLSKLVDYTVGEKYKNEIVLSMNDWLIDVSKDLVINFECE